MQSLDSEGRKSARKEAVDWLLRQEEGALDAAGQEAFDRWLRAKPQNAAAYREAEQLFRMSGTALAEKPEETRRALRGKSRGGGTIATGILVLFLLSGAAFWLADGPLRLQATAMTGPDDMRMVELADGSRIHLNASSAIAEHLDDGLRTVTLLRGEAYFEVAKDPARPFLVHAGEGAVRVLGTAFNVNLTSTYAEITVTENTVEVSAAPGGRQIAVTAGERVAYDRAGALGPVSPSSGEPSWRSGRLVFDERRLDNVVEELARHIRGRVVVLGEGTRQRRISGSFDLSDPERALESFGSIFGLRKVALGPLLTVLY